MYLGIEIGGTKLQLGLGAGDGRILALERLAVPPDGRRADAIRDQLRRGFETLSRRAGGTVTAVGIGFGGPVDADRGIVRRSHQVPGWDDFPLADWARRIFGVGPVAVQNDADTAALAEARFGAGVGCSPVVYVTIGSGIGGGLVIDGRIYRGSGAGALEIGHLWTDLGPPGPETIEPGQPVEPAASRRATVEQVASGWSIAARARAALRRRRIEGAAAASPLADLLGPGTPEDAGLTTEQVAAAARLGDPIASSVLAEATGALGAALAGVVTLLAPRRIILGGGVSLIGDDLWFAPIRRALDHRVFAPFRGTFDVVPAALGEEVVVQGALALARDVAPQA